MDEVKPGAKRPSRSKKAPRIKEVDVSIRLGGKLQIVQFQYQADYSYLVGFKYDVDMTQEEAHAFWKERHAELSKELGPVEQVKVDELMALRDSLSKRASQEDE